MTADSPLAPPESPSNLLTEWARLLLDSFAAAGVRQVVISPGSRSTPFVAAAAEHPALQCHDIVDERSAAFFALGQAKVSGRPSLLLCTSGSAGAHYLPAVLEARQSHTPLLLLTADRPFELMDCAAPQTVDQTRFLGHHATYVELGEPSTAPMALRALRRKAVQAVWRSHHPEPGAVHLNARAKKPLEPQPAGADASPAAEHLRAAVDQLLQLPAPHPIAATADVSAHDLDPVAEACRQARRGLILCGPAALAQVASREAVFELAAATGFPLLAEASSQLRFAPDLPTSTVGAFDLLFGSPALLDGPAPDLILQLGTPAVSGTWGRYLAGNPEIPHAVLAPHGWNDAVNTARWLVFAPVGAACRALATALTRRSDEPGESWQHQRQSWLQRFQEAEAAAWAAADAVLSEQDGLSEGATARRLVEMLPEGSLLSLGNSLPIRQVDRWVPPSSKTLHVLSQRGHSGIDGLISSAAGAATASAPAVPAALLLGDLSFLHDVGGLAVAARLRRPLAIVVVNNQGGRIFEHLPIADAVAPQTFDHWLTPQDWLPASASAAFRLPHHTCSTLAELDAALGQALEHPGATVVEAVVPASGARETHRRRRDELERRLAGPLASGGAGS